MSRKASTALRAAGFLTIWLALTGGRLADIPAGIIAAALATWASLILLPPAAMRINPWALSRLGGRFLVGSLSAGIDVSRRALSPALPLKPGIVFYPSRLPKGSARDAFRALMSLQPGTLPTEDVTRNGFLIHCLDLDQPVLEIFAREEEAFAHAIGLSLRPRGERHE